MKCPGIVWAVLLCVGLATDASGQEWKPQGGRLMTRWAKDVSPQKVHPEYPRPQLVRSEWLCLNGLWQLDQAKADAQPPVGKTLPGRILVPFPVESALSGMMAKADRVWYRRTFKVPEKWRGQRILLHFQAVDWEASVFVNGKPLGTHRGGYDAFSFDITDALQGAGDQELIVGVFDPSDAGDQPRGKQVNRPTGIWYTSTTGIWQSVWLEPVPAARIGRILLVPDVDASCLRLTVEGIGTGSDHTVQALIRDGSSDVAQAFGRVGAEIKIGIPKDKLKLWSPATPFLYDLSVTLKQGEVAADHVQSYFGMRKIDAGKDAQGVLRLRLNNEPCFLVGPLDQGFWPDGLYTAPSDEALRYDVQVTRDLGFNMTRKHVKIEPARWYYWCDKLGLLVWQDMPSGNNRTAAAKAQFETELRRMVEGFRNHPSIIVWVVFNEGWGQHDTERYCEAVKKWDRWRLVNNASGWTDKKVGDVLDIHAYPGPAAPAREATRASVLGEFGGLGLGVDGHTWAAKTWGYRGTASKEDLTRKYIGLLGRAWGLKESHGLCAAVYTQITDVETECNGLLTYDRALLKVDVPRVAAANRGHVPQRKVLVPTSQSAGVVWRYVFDQPAGDWFKPGFDDSKWKQGPGGFGTAKTPGAVVRTEWKTADIWLRREFDMPATPKAAELSLLVHHDEDCEIYINGVLAAKAAENTSDYEELSLMPQGRAALKPGKNVIAVHCKQTLGGQYIDAGIVELTTPEEPGAKK
ncbi:glycoside hydrolase family 2 [archaeon]|nr:MAG: glycoside hydrolase family 2 [archaeon]